MPAGTITAGPRTAGHTICAACGRDVLIERHGAVYTVQPHVRLSDESAIVPCDGGVSFGTDVLAGSRMLAARSAQLS